MKLAEIETWWGSGRENMLKGKLPSPEFRKIGASGEYPDSPDSVTLSQDVLAVLHGMFSHRVIIITNKHCLSVPIHAYGQFVAGHTHIERFTVQACQLVNHVGALTSGSALNCVTLPGYRTGIGGGGRVHGTGFTAGAVTWVGAGR